ncbi:MFS-type transporter-like protein [Leptotrombidium deliense]|uniref:MFS-type transporter-like protein n=1 Tax=Leptotrombidium deliense TaxID=299467 RepID=A0A443SKN6_9ACAR|nr:MFS-type transporter-like protein [Leptotrombidium deliense]
MVFAVYGLVLMIMSPLIGKILPEVGVKFVIICGIVCSGVSNILFGLLDRIGDSTTFTIYCFVIRIFEGLGAASVSTASYAYIMKTFPDYVGTAFGLTETCVGLGMSLGPAIGGGLYALGGYPLPFFVLGCVVLINIPICWCILQSKKEFEGSEDSSTDSSAMKLSYYKLVTIPEIIVICCVIVIVSQSVGFLDPTIEPHLRQFGIGAQYVGLVFLLLSAIYAICSPITGYVASRTEQKLLIMLVGLLFTTVGLLFIGPAYFIPLKSSVYLTTGMMGLLGFSLAVAFIPTFESILVTAIKKGYGDDLNTYSLVSGLWSSMYALGEVTGPFLGGVLLEATGFSNAATIMGCFSLISVSTVLT